ncbi:MAG: VOC family protein [Rickettsiales bacterium]|nr:VOC family protein [Pseudomonadota bacterium]MDA0966959.1 VOC family protein [Pseudomonadota bacterium]MDG4543878.1 VOC family protein [Rickettsiales bacterium]MDG4546024.1 VOC family protein [Rickettsiales bacterium]MDG4548270.1 VOC family protein [Rickettsiales bacterium]
MQPFHLAIASNDLDKSKKFYSQLLGCTIGRSSKKWIDFNFFGHQLSVHLKPEETTKAQNNKVDGKSVPVRHFGIVLDWANWLKLAKELEEQNMDFIIEPYIRFEGKPGEQATMFFYDPSGNALEFKSFKDESMLFAA